MNSSSVPVHWWPLILGVGCGFLARILTLRSDYRHYPSYPSGYTGHLTLGFIAAVIGAVFLPAVAVGNYTAATFLTLAASQFRDVRSTERKALSADEEIALVQRGAGYIEGIAKTFEARNYLVMAAALITSGVTYFLGITVGTVTAVLAVWAVVGMKSGRTIGDLVDIQPGKIHFEKGTLLFVDDVMLMEVGLPHPRQRYLEEGLGVILTPRNPRGQAVLWDLAQRQAIAHDAAAVVGVQKDVGYPEQVPLCRMDMPGGSGKAALAIIPVEQDMEALLQAIRMVPVLESAKGNPVVSKLLRQRQKPGRKPWQEPVLKS